MPYSKLANTMFSYVLTMDECRSVYPDEHKPSFIKLTTITMTSKELFKCSKSKLEKIRACFTDMDGITIRKKGSTNTGIKWTLKPSVKFYNQVTLGYEDAYSKKSIKIFPNGSIQVAGCCDLFDCKRIISQLSTLLRFILKLDYEIPSDQFEIKLVNTNYSLNYHVNLYEVINVFADQDMFNVTYNPERYSAVLIKFKPAADMKQITASIFSTGKIIITGAQTLKEIVFAYNIINRMIFENKDTIKTEKSEESDLFGIFLGYKIPELVEFLKNKNMSSWKLTRSNNKIEF